MPFNLNLKYIIHEFKKNTKLCEINYKFNFQFSEKRLQFGNITLLHLLYIYTRSYISISVSEF